MTSERLASATAESSWLPFIAPMAPFTRVSHAGCWRSWSASSAQPGAACARRVSDESAAASTSMVASGDDV